MGRAPPGPVAEVAAPLPAPVLAYLEHVRVEKRLAERTHTLYTLDLRRLLAFAQAAGVDVLALQTPHIRRFAAQMHGSGRSGRGIALILSGWRGFFRWAARQALVPMNPVDGVRAPRAPKPLPKALAVEDALQLMNHVAAQADPWLEARDAAITELLYSSGLRVAELVGLDVAPGPQTQRQARGWIDFAAGEAHVLGKGSKRRIVPVGSAALAALQRWCALREGVLPPHSAAARVVPGGAAPRSDGFEDGGPAPAASPDLPESALFIGRRGARLTAQSVWVRLRQRARQAGLVTSVHPHVLRHTFASHLLQSSGDLRAVQELLGHASIATTQIYTRLDFQHLAQAYDKAHPRARKK